MITGASAIALPVQGIINNILIYGANRRRAVLLSLCIIRYKLLNTTGPPVNI